MITKYLIREFMDLTLSLAKTAEIESEHGIEKVLITDKLYLSENTVQIIIDAPVTSVDIKAVRIRDKENNIILEQLRSVTKINTDGLHTSFVIKFSETELEGGNIFEVVNR